MGNDDTLRTAARWTALGALFLIPLAPLIVVNGLFFPFITGKAFYFRIMVEIAVAAWAVLAVLDKAYRPRFSLAGAVVLAFVLWMAVADAFAINAQKAFWSNFERMEGWVLLAHLAGFFFAASAVLRVERKWRAWFGTSLAVGFLVSCYAILQLIDPAEFIIHQGSTRIDASMGNSAYLAIYLLFNLFIAAWLALSTERKALKWWLLAFAGLEGFLLFFTETRGTILGLAGALTLAGLLTAATASKRARRWALGGLAALLLIVGGLYLARDSSFVHSNSSLERLTSISLAEGQTRFQIWHMAWEGFLARPVTGWGQEGFNYVFDRFYDPRLYGQEPWFDRAHNAFLDWLIAGGAPGFILFISLFGVAVWLLWRYSELSRAERIALTAALAGYAVHELFVFDNLYSYVYLFAILALIHSQVARPIAFFERAKELPSDAALTYAVPMATVVGVFLLWFVNIPGLTVATDLITALSSSNQGLDHNIELFTELSDHPAFAAQEVREQLIAFFSAIAGQQGVTDEQRAKVAKLAVEGMQKQVAAYPLDTREQVELSYAYQAAGDYKSALEATLEAAKLTPTKEDIWLMAGMLAWNMGDTKGAQGYFEKAYELAPGQGELAAYAAAGYYGLGDSAKGDAILTERYGTTTVDSPVLATAYYQGKDWVRLLRIWELRAAKPDATAETYFNLAAAQYAAGRSAAAIATIRAAIARFPQAADSGVAAIKQIQSGVPLQ